MLIQEKRHNEVGMRIIAGRYKQAHIEVPKSGTRPMLDRVRESVFSSLTNEITFDGANVLDIFAGSGSLGIEALSRGASSAVFIDSGKEPNRLIRENLSNVGESQRVYKADAIKWTSHKLRGGEKKFDVVFIDPPYDMESSEIDKILENLAQNEYLHSKSLIILERRAKSKAPEIKDNLRVISKKLFGESAVYKLELYHKLNDA
jgi:16S rRNA (guanine966-N2)-methyltransferase